MNKKEKNILLNIKRNKRNKYKKMSTKIIILIIIFLILFIIWKFFVQKKKSFFTQPENDFSNKGKLWVKDKIIKINNKQKINLDSFKN